MPLFGRGSRPSDDVPPWPEQAQAVRLLLVDDDEDEYQLLRGALSEIRGTSYELEWCDTYSKGLDLMTQGGRHAYLVDYRLGALSGVDLVREARSLGCEAPLIMLTGESSRSVDMEAMEAGATDFLQKGKTPPHLLERTIRYAITHTETTQALRRTLRQISGIEAFGRLLSEKGPVPEVLDEVVRLLADDFDIGQASVYVMENGELHLGAVNGYDHAAPRLDPNGGRLARVVSSGRPGTLPNVTTDPEARTGAEPMELCSPLMAEGGCMGVLNVAWSEQSANQDFQRGLHIVADRLAVGLALNRAVRGRSYV